MNDGPVVAPVLPPPATSFDAQGRYVGSSTVQATAALASEEAGAWNGEQPPEPSNVERMLSEQLAYRVRHLRLHEPQPHRYSSAHSSSSSSSAFYSAASPGVGSRESGSASALYRPPHYQRPYEEQSNESSRTRGYQPQHWGPRPARSGRGRGGYYQRH